MKIVDKLQIVIERLFDGDVRLLNKIYAVASGVFPLPVTSEDAIKVHACTPKVLLYSMCIFPPQMLSMYTVRMYTLIHSGTCLKATTKNVCDSYILVW